MKLLLYIIYDFYNNFPLKLLVLYSLFRSKTLKLYNFIIFNAAFNTLANSYALAF